MKIAQVAPLFERVPPRLYGGTERVVSYLTEELVRQGHEVTLFASGDSKTSAELVRCCDVALRLNPVVTDSTPLHVIMMEEVRRRADKFDILHFHIDFLHCALVRDFAQRTVTTLHGRLDLPHIVPFYTVFREFPLVAVSGDQRKYLRGVNWAGAVHHGLPRDLLPFQPKASDGYLAFLGRIAPEKRPDHAIEIAVKTGMQLKIAAKIDRVDQVYWDEKNKPDGEGPCQRGIRWRDRRAPKGLFPGTGVSLVISSRLARAIWSGHDRGHGVWNAGYCS